MKELTPLSAQCKEAVPLSPAHRDKGAKGYVSCTAAQPKAGLQKPKKGVNYLAGGTSFWGEFIFQEFRLKVHGH